MTYLMDSLPGSLRAWVNGLRALTLPEITQIEKSWQSALVGLYCSGTMSKEEATEAWTEWQRLKREEIAYLIEENLKKGPKFPLTAIM